MGTSVNLTIAADHPAFAGHFPGNPIVPGVVLLDEALLAVGTQLGNSGEAAKVLSAKFLGVVRPGEALALEYDRDPAGRVRLTARAGPRDVLAATVEFPTAAARVEPAPRTATAATTLPAEDAPAWTRRAERGSMAMLKLMTRVSLALGRRASRLLLHGIAAYFFLSTPGDRAHTYEYLRRALGRRPTARDRYRRIFAFATAIHDRLFLLNDRYDLFDVTIEGEDVARAALSTGQGALLMGAHLGSFEVIRSVGHRQAGLEVAMAMYADNARKINAALTAINPALKLDVIALGHVSAMLQIRSRLEAGAVVGLMGDRSFSSDECQTVEFLGAPARFPTGPMRLACMLQRPVYFMAGLYLGGNRYRVVFEPIADFSATPREARAAAIAQAICRYASLLERRCRSAPYNWFNFFDFWAAAERR
jgi:predicted LPLAT superfamily acyltransferase